MKFKLFFLLFITTLICLVSCGSTENSGGNGEYSVSFYNRGNLYSITSVDEGELSIAPLPPELEGFDFIGWYNGDNAWDFSADTVCANLTLTAKWSADFKALLVDYDIDGISLSSDGVYLKFDTNPEDVASFHNEKLLAKIKKLNKDLFLPDSLYLEMISTLSGSGGTYTNSEYVTVEWENSLKTGLVITYTRK